MCFDNCPVNTSHFTAAATCNTTDLNSDEYDWRRRLSRKNTTGGGLAKYGWRRRLRGGGSGDYFVDYLFKTLCACKTVYAVIEQ